MPLDGMTWRYSLHGFQALIWRTGIDAASGSRFVRHTGSVKGTRSHLINFPGKDLAVSVHFNLSQAEPDIGELALAIARLYL